MKTDNSRAFEEKYQEGYTKRCNDLVHANLILVETELFELTDEERTHFEELYAIAKGTGFDDKELRAIALDWLTSNCKCINTITHAYNY
jgi:hypothetical protein